MKPFNLFFLGLVFLVSCSKENQTQDNHIFSEGPVVVRGQILNAESKTVQLENLELTGRVKNVVKLDSLGNFEISINILSPHDNFLIHNGQMLTIFTEPNDTIIISADGRNFKKTISFSGSNAIFNKSLKLFFEEFLEQLETNEFFIKKRDLSPSEFKVFAYDFFELMETKIDSIIKITQPQENAIEWMRNYVKYRLAEDLIEYGNHHKENLTPDYYDFENDYLLTGEFELQCSQYYEDFINKYYLGYKLSQVDGFKEMATNYREQTYDGLKSSFEFIDKNISIPIVKNLSITRFCNMYVEKDYLIVDSIFNTFTTYVHDITCQNFILKRLDNKKNKIALVDNLEELSNTDFIGEIFQKIRNENHGKVLYIDVWGTWCGGCLSAFPTSNKLYKELDRNKIEFIYLCVNSTKENWQEIVNEYELKGKNYLLTQDQSAMLSEKFNFHGVPRYIIIDKNGKIIDYNAKHPYSSALKVELQELAEI
ncbi:TlpA family protein disulfide reductase [Carboxylicivirga mesophila]|uniref:TlpA family protein disulfide reductase n=1 Tax=Carboxylicivirga mesophila TaxID=1166478 RepID=A0ABS5KIF9_9BACT|nr:TlpA disulfide reductase family protein [Carboxylicivirga mesophila]MBS2213998.1 TlpA family protein disulfide reductase [Carboxylicivirga mesophila]